MVFVTLNFKWLFEFFCFYVDFEGISLIIHML
jgi:hypothetical protein